jgi:oxalate decarboxylase
MSKQTKQTSELFHGQAVRAGSFRIPAIHKCLQRGWQTIVMPDEKLTPSRRGLFELGSAVALAASAGLALPRPAEAAPGSGEKFEPLENFKYGLDGSKGWEGPGGSAKEATVTQLPVLNSIAAVSMRLTAGGLRELHWHAIAAEWAYMVEGRCRITVMAPNGQAEVVDFNKGDTWFFPKGHPHSLQGLGPDGCHFVLAFDDGHFSEFGTFSITDWFAQTPPHILAQNTNLDLEELARLPKKEVYIVQGKVPPDDLPKFRNKSPQENQSPHKYRLADQPAFAFPGGEERIVTQKAFPIQTSFTSALLRIDPGGLRELHWHPNADEWAFVLEGSAEVGIFGAHARFRKDNFDKGDIWFIQQGFGHYIKNTGTADLRLVLVFSNPEYENISLSTWLGLNPELLLADNFELGEEVVRELPKDFIGIVKPKGV